MRYVYNYGFCTTVDEITYSTRKHDNVPKVISCAAFTHFDWENTYIGFNAKNTQQKQAYTYTWKVKMCKGRQASKQIMINIFTVHLIFGENF
jgi:hypothetical protein